MILSKATNLSFNKFIVLLSTPDKSAMKFLTLCAELSFEKSFSSEILKTRVLSINLIF